MEDSRAPTLKEKKPEAQLTQIDDDALGWYLPASQVVQMSAPLAEYCPAEHCLQLVDPAPARKVPAAQKEQTAAPAAE